MSKKPPIKLTPSYGKGSEFSFISYLGAGSFGSVYKIRDNKTHIEYAIKSMKLEDNHEVEEGVLTEISDFQVLHHPNIVKVYEAELDFQKNLVNIRMELCVSDVYHRIQEYGRGNFGHLTQPLPQQELFQRLLQWTMDMFAGLNYIHENGIIHNDLKPGNLLIDIDNRVKVADYGLSSLNDGYKQDFYKATWDFRAPELVCLSDQLVSTASDIWSAGCTIQWMFFDSSIMTQPNSHKRIQQDQTNLRNVSLSQLMWEYIGFPPKHIAETYAVNSPICNATLHGRYNDNGHVNEQYLTGDKASRQVFKDYFGNELYDALVSLIRHCLMYDPSKRITWHEIKQLPLFQSCHVNDTVHGVYISLQLHDEARYILHRQQFALIIQPFMKFANTNLDRIFVLAGAILHECLERLDSLNALEKEWSGKPRIIYEATCVYIAFKLLEPVEDSFQLADFRQTLVTQSTTFDVSVLESCELEIYRASGMKFYEFLQKRSVITTSLTKTNNKRKHQ